MLLSKGAHAIFGELNPWPTS